MTRRISERGKALIRSYESCRLRAYKDVRGVWTVGWGHTRHAHAGLVIPQGMADFYFGEDCGIVEREIARVLKPAIVDALSQEQFDALGSFAFNLGVRPKAHAIWALINTGKFEDVPARLLKYNKALIDGKLIAVSGLTRRRRAEAEMWQEDGEDVVLTARHAPVEATQTEKPLAQSKTFALGGIVTTAGILQATGAVTEGAKQVQAVVAPQADNSALGAHLMQVTSTAIILAGVAVCVVRWWDGKKRRA